MPRHTRTLKPRAPYVPAVPTGSAWIESDSYDRRIWNEVTTASPSIGELVASGTTLAPHFDAMLQDLFLALFKLNVVWLKPDDVRRAALLNRLVLEQLIPTPAFAALKQRTQLEEDKAAIAAIVVGEQVREMFRSEKLFNRSELLDLWDLAHQEADLATRAAALRNAQELKEEHREADDPQLKKHIDELADAAKRAAAVSEARLNQKARQLDTAMRNADLSELKRMQLTSIEMASEIERVAQDSHDFSREFGQGGRLPAAERLELGRRLAGNRKLGELARLVGRFKQDARALRRRTLDRGVSEAYDVERGSEIGRLIPAELVSMHHPGLRRDFGRRLLEGSLLQYRLREDEQKGKGPMVVCIDVSSSMQGEKELWSKAVALTLMDIARRQRRLFRAVMFSSGEGTLKILDLNGERRYQPELSKVLDMAEYFPGGGTEFEAPIDAAVDLVTQKNLKRADIVIITDGECQVSDEWLHKLQLAKDDLEFAIFGVLIDVGSSELSTLAKLSDRVTSLRKLTDEGAREIFVSV
ncbi:MAG: vWA domain-containing protein [Candidatus Binataceae bacterium]